MTAIAPPHHAEARSWPLADCTRHRKEPEESAHQGARCRHRRPRHRRPRCGRREHRLAIKAGIRIPQERIAQEKVPNNPYRNFIAVNEQDANAPWVRGLVESYQQPNVSAAILKVYRGATLPAWDGAPR